MYKLFFCFVIFTFYSVELIDCTRVIADDRFLEECLSAHNKYRDLHENTPRLKLGRNATEYALNRVMALAQMDNHRMPADKRAVFGENFYWYYDTAGYHSCKDAVDVWYNGIGKYNYNRPGFADSTGGFSQVVWRGSQYIGCALIEQDKNIKYPETFIVCNYWPAGNIDNQYPYNVYPVKERPERPPSGPSGGSGSGSSSNNEWSSERPGGQGGHRPGTGNRPDERPIINTGNRPGSGSHWSGDRPGSSSGADAGIWTVPSRPVQSQPPKPPRYPLILLHPII